MNSPASNLALARLREKRAAGLGDSGIPVRTATGPFDATPAQRGIWLHEQLADNGALYHVPVGLKIGGSLDAQALRQAAAAVVREQHALRTVFAATPELVAEVREDLELDWQLHDLRLVPEAARAEAAQQLLASRATARFDLLTGPPVRWTLLRLAENEWILAIVAHHLVLDGLSMTLLVEQLWAAYGGAPVTPARQYADFAEWNAGQPPRTTAIERRAARLRGAPPLDVAVGRARPPRVRNDGARLHEPVPSALAATIRDAAAAHGVPPFVFLLACYQLTLTAHTGQYDFGIGIPMAARPQDELARTIGHFVNTVPVRSDIAAGQTFAELLRLVRDTAMAAYEDETVPFERIVEAVGGPWDPRFSPVFQVLFVQQRLQRPDLSRWDLEVDWQTIETGATLYDLVLHIAEAGTELVCELTYNTALLDADAARNLVHDFLSVAGAAAAEPDAPVARLVGSLPRHHLVIAVADEKDALASGLAEALYRGGIPARVLPITADEALDARTDLLVAPRGFGDASGALVDGAAAAGVGILALAPEGHVLPENLSGRTVLVPATAPDSYEAGWELGRRLLAWTTEPAPAELHPAVAAWLAERTARPIPEQPEFPATLLDSSVAADGSTEPEGPLEIRLAQLWAQALDVAAVGRNDDFFLLGGTSLAATRLLSQLLDEFGVQISLRDLFERPTVAQAARLLESALAEGDSVAALRPAERAEGDLLPVSYAQERLWFLETFAPGNSTYIMPGGLRLRGKVDVAAIESALNRVEERHEVLRTVYLTTEDGELRQQVRPYAPRTLPVSDLTGLPSAERDRLERELAASVYSAPFDLATGPVWRYHLLVTGPDEHLLMIALHHIVCDGWSIAVLSQEISAHYRALQSGVTAELPPLAVQYADYAVWQRDNADHLDAQLEYWRQNLTGALNTEVPGDYRRPPRRSSNGAVEYATLDPAVMAEMRKIAAAQGVTTFAVLLAAFYTMLHRYTRQYDLTVASPIAGRTRSATEPLVGCFLNTLALRAEVDPEESFTDLVARVGKIVLEAHANQDCPFEKVIAALVPQRDLSRNPLAQVMFNYLNTPPPALDMAGVDVAMVDAPRRTAKLDLDLTVDETGGEIKLSLEYSTDLYEADTARRFLRHFAGALATIAADPRRSVGEITLGDPVRSTEPVVWGLPGLPTVPEPEPGETLADRLAHVARTRAAAKALSNDERTTTYAELDALADDAARQLLRVVGEPGGRVALLYDHSPESFVAVWAALRAGVTYVPLDPRAPQARLIEILEEAKVSALLCDPARIETARAIAGEARILPVSARPGEAHLSPGPVNHVEHALAPEDPAYITYTSGSTGRPKGVAQSSENALAHAVCYARRLRIGPDDVVAAPARYTFDAGILNSFGAAVAGAELHVIDPHLFTPAALRAEIESAGVTVLHCTPTLFRYLLSDAVEPWLPSKIRLVGLGGEQVVPGDVTDFGQHFGPHTTFISLYGPTECSVALQHIITPEDVDRVGVPIGAAVDIIDVDIVDEKGRPTEVFGELTLRSPHVALGYWQRPELTESVFGTDAEGVRYYRTGDLARRLTDGQLVFVGRKDRQVKIRGHRVEPGEAETVLRSHHTVGEAAVVLDRYSSEPRLVAYVTQDGPLTPDYSELSSYLRTRLPEYMIPSAYLVLDALPRGLTGKLDQNRLPRIAPAADPVFTPPRTELEKAVAEVWGEVLEREVGLGQNFFDLGGHSLALARARGLLERRLGVQLAMTDLFAAPTVEDLARLLAGRTTEPEDTDRGRDRRAAAARRRAHRRPGSPDTNGSDE
ncbi:amino acid adenylation domain-containing protein [Nocardia sp. CDC159]|uniref:Amino acid adenylation domain-containing protein n=1 Tax=Nocardia pulmonis TaxID=2951408 RepID=A0A9X2EI35_9NOCA|nr:MULTISPECIES: non-ribosomal peptide synthetase [Nocardia]MCM6778633.1 amino acid adenylation domain-containing protein [Nocardia pulmonis]MCM6791522.1 amino acid adenylation domain-containing protein [Nocardia sp. CDC159]